MKTTNTTLIKDATHKRQAPTRVWVLEEMPSKSWGEMNRYIRKNSDAMHLPPWMEQADEWPEITPERFIELRKFMLQLKAVQCAALLRVNPSTVWRWENGSIPIPFAAYMALRLLLDVRFLPHQVKEWEGWQIINAGPDVGMLYDSKRSGTMVSPGDIRAARYAKGERDAWQRRAEKAETKAAELEAENTRLRQLFNAQGVTKELRQMQEKLSAMLDDIGTAEIIDYRPAAASHHQEKAA
ncbi:hypothetical protein [Sulfuritalea hydrogenivorans]|uniref:Uncharacterized protein n=1 Tax=Sulfuritalea hydrogenivorans sk43H TaxID=1223802 RepID=W0SIN4_9PROT|nr:hypothetical protein [Sulfuritalea hydrogenivorans]BAO30416.1 hypothetical protein SUTH_02634 [Sulfuritalea hydrogenivorans sk43H]